MTFEPLRVIMVSTIEEIKNCPACGSDNLVHVTSRDQVICKDCGMVHEPFSSVAKEVLEITHPPEETPVSTERIKAVMPKPKVKVKVKKIKKKKPKKKKKKKAKKKVKKKKIKKKPKNKVKKKIKKKPKKKVKKKPVKKKQKPKPKRSLFKRLIKRKM